MSNEKIIEYLQRAVKMEMTAAHQYQLHAHTLDDWGLTKLADQMREEMAEELGHSDLFIERLMFLKAKPDLGFDKAPVAAETLPAMFKGDLADEEEAIALANASTYGLAAGVYTRDVSRAHRVANRLEAGMVFVNRYGCYDFASPFGGFKQSGWGKEMAIHSLASYTRLKSIWIAL